MLPGQGEALPILTEGPVWVLLPCRPLLRHLLLFAVPTVTSEEPNLSSFTVTNAVPAEQTITLTDMTNHESQSWTFATGDPHDDIGDTNVAGAIGDQV